MTPKENSESISALSFQESLNKIAEAIENAEFYEQSSTRGALSGPQVIAAGLDNLAFQVGRIAYVLEQKNSLPFE